MRTGRIGVLIAATLVGGVGFGDERPSLETVSNSEDHAISSGSWRYIVKRTQRPWACVVAGKASSCVEHALVIDNSSPQTLECAVRLEYTAADGTVVSDGAKPVLVLTRISQEIHGRVTAADTTVTVAQVDCVARPPYARIEKVAGCEYQMFGKPFESYYPQFALQAALEGPVVVSFLLPKRNGAALEVKVAESSLVPALDAAALKFVADQRFTTKCPGTRFDMRMRFELRDQHLGAPGSQGTR